MSCPRALLHHHGSDLWRCARALAGEGELAHELWQETAARALAATPPPHPLAARVWLFRILRNAFLDTRRRARPQVPVEELELADPAPRACEAALVAETTVRQGLARLLVAHREIIGLVDIAGLSYAEAAEALGVPAGTVMSRLARARAALLAAIAEDAAPRVVAFRRTGG